MLIGKIESSETGKTINPMSNGKEKAVSELKLVKTKPKEEKNVSDSQSLDTEPTALHAAWRRKAATSISRARGPNLARYAVNHAANSTTLEKDYEQRQLLSPSNGNCNWRQRRVYLEINGC
jgi:hypothetical protein